MHNCKHIASGTPRRVGFTLVELMIVIAIIAVLFGLIAPATAAAWSHARMIQCAANVRQITAGLLQCAAADGGRFPENVYSPAPGRYWFDYQRIGRFLPYATLHGDSVGGMAFKCPTDDGGQMSYSMNGWASKTMDIWDYERGKGTPWTATVCNASKMVLLIEAFSCFGSRDEGYYAWPMVGLVGDVPGRRFGARGGISPLAIGGRWGLLGCEIPYERHPGRTGTRDGLGRVNIGFADGHVASKSSAELADPDTAALTGEAYWSPVDVELERIRVAAAR